MKSTPGSPFHPTFGSSPPELAGRHTILDSVGDALDDEAGAAARGSMITGARGIGKTATLNAVEDLAAERGWLVVSETVSKGLVARLVDERVPSAREALAAPNGRTVSGVTLPAGLGGITLGPLPTDRSWGLRESMERLIALVEEHGGSGLLLTLDEVHGRDGRTDLVEVAVQLQHLIRRDRNVALVAAGLPAAVQDLLNDDVTTFLRRAKRFRLGPLTSLDAEDALRIPLEREGRPIAAEALSSAVAASHGYPYLIQTIGDYAWKRAPAEQPIGTDHVEWAVQRAIADMGIQVHAPALHDLSPRDREFLAAMAQDDGPSRIGAVADRMGRDLSYTSRYRARLLAAEVIQAAGHGTVEFALPYLREHLRGQLE